MLQREVARDALGGVERSGMGATSAKFSAYHDLKNIESSECRSF